MNPRETDAPETRRHPAGAFRVIAVNAAIACALLALLEVGMRLADRRYEFYARTQPGQFSDRTLGARHWPRKDAELGWVFSEGAPDFYWTGSAPQEYKPNAAGFRDARDFGAADHTGKTRVMMLGDSFLFGIYLNADDAIPAVLEHAQPGYEAFNLGIPGWGIDQMYLSYLRYADSIRPQIVVLVYIDEDLNRAYEAFRVTEGMNKPSFAVEHGNLVLRTLPTPPPRIARSLIARSVIANKLYAAYTDLQTRSLAKTIFAQLAAETTRRGQRLVVVRVPRREDLGGRSWPDIWSLESFFHDQHVAYIDPLPAMRGHDEYYLKGNLHLNALGAAQVANILANSSAMAPSH